MFTYKLRGEALKRSRRFFERVMGQIWRRREGIPLFCEKYHLPVNNLVHTDVKGNIVAILLPKGVTFGDCLPYGFRYYSKHSNMICPKLSTKVGRAAAADLLKLRVDLFDHALFNYLGVIDHGIVGNKMVWSRTVFISQKDQYLRTHAPICHPDVILITDAQWKALFEN